MNIKVDPNKFLFATSVAIPTVLQNLLATIRLQSIDQMYLVGGKLLAVYLSKNISNERAI